MIGLAMSFLAGLVFAVGLALAGMTSPAKVVAFLDVSGSWDPSLALVMAAAIAAYLPAYLATRHRARPFAAHRFALPPENPIDARLLGGAAIFGAGWGLSGFCPGPAIVSLAAAAHESLLFVAGMVGALLLYEAARSLRSPT